MAEKMQLIREVKNFQEFNQSVNFEKNGEKNVLPLRPDIYGAAVAEQYAAMIVRYWRELYRRGCLRSSAYLDVIDLCPGIDTSGALLMAAIRRRIRPGEFSMIRYLPWGAADQVWAHGELLCRFSLHGHIESGARLSIDDSTTSQSFLYGAENPLVVISHGAWAQMPQELFAMHYGRLLRANLVAISTDDTKDDEKIWEPVDDTCWDSALETLLAYYRNEFNSSPLVYPTGTLQALDALLASAPFGTLLLSCLDGCADELGIRLTSFAGAIGAYRRSGCLPVNLQLIAAWVRASGGYSKEIELSAQRVLQVLQFGPPSGPELIESVTRCFDPCTFDSAVPLSEICRLMGSSFNLDVRLSLLQMSKFDPSVFSSGASDMVRSMGNSPDFDRKRWQYALEQVWERFLLYPSDDSVYHWLSQAAMHCGQWRLARDVLKQSLRKRGDNALDLANLAWCESRTGQLKKGLELVSSALAIDPAHSLANEVSHRLGERFTQRDSRWRVELRDQDNCLVLEPLDPSHAHALSHQYRDGQIAVMTGLPQMHDTEKIKKWIIESNQETGRVNFAVVHADWGFVGFINFAISQYAAFFCFWTGVDFQGRGYATTAGRLACRHAKECGVPLILTSAYKDNLRSIRALKRMGFNELSIRACPPDHERVFFSLYDRAECTFDSNQELIEYYRRENLPMEFENFSESNNQIVNQTTVMEKAP